MRSLFVGRFQPFHDGHKALMETRLKEGKSILVAIRDTPFDSSNPYTAQDRAKMVLAALKPWGHLVSVIIIPDIDEICYGRDVGYKVTKIDLDPEIEAISATKIREAQ